MVQGCALQYVASLARTHEVCDDASRSAEALETQQQASHAHSVFAAKTAMALLSAKTDNHSDLRGALSISRPAFANVTLRCPFDFVTAQGDAVDKQQGVASRLSKLHCVATIAGCAPNRRPSAPPPPRRTPPPLRVAGFDLS